MEILIDTISPNGYVNIKLIDVFPSQNPEKRKWCFIKLMNIEQDLFITNDKLKELYSIHNILSNRDASDYNPMIYSRMIFKYFKLCKEIVHDLRCTIEMMLLLTSLVSDSDKKIDTIDKYLKLVNDFSNAKMIEEPVEKIISDFNLFYNHAFHEIKEFSKKAKRS